MALNTLSVTIPAGKSVSDGLDCTGSSRIVRLIMPAAWTAAPITFCMSPDGVKYHDLYHTSAAGLDTYEIKVPVVTPDSVVAFPEGSGTDVAWVKIRSGTHAVPVIQPADRTFQVVVEIPDEAAGGEAGAAGPTGPSGVAGPTGSVGPPGAMGAQGLAGPTGSAGSAGPAGPTGAAGTSSGQGVTDGSTAAPGDKGEYLYANSAAATNLTTLITANVASINLPPGDFDIWGAVIFQPASTGPNSLTSAISGVSATLPTNADVTAGFGTMSEIWSSSMPSGKRQVLLTGQCTSNLATAKIVYLVAQASFGGGSVAVSGYISARRAR